MRGKLRNLRIPMANDSADAVIPQQIVRKTRWGLLPFRVLLYLIAFLDRFNISFAALTMNAELGTTARQFGGCGTRARELNAAKAAIRSTFCRHNSVELLLCCAIGKFQLNNLSSRRALRIPKRTCLMLDLR